MKSANVLIKNWKFHLISKRNRVVIASEAADEPHLSVALFYRYVGTLGIHPPLSFVIINAI